MGLRPSFQPGSGRSSRSIDLEKTMTPSTLDLFFLTFNCAKNLIDVGPFSAHLYGALAQHAAGLPDLVALSLQEVAPLSYAFLGSYFLSPYYARYEEALNLASAKLLATSSADAGEDGDSRIVQPQGAERTPQQPYTLVRAKNVGMTAIMLFARDPSAVLSIEEAECGFGAADMGNKGAVALRVRWGTLAKSTEVTLVATHLAAMEWNLKKRNANWRTIMSSLTFANPRSVLPGLFPTDTTGPTPDRSGSGGSKVAPPESSSDTSEAEDEAEGDDTSKPLLGASSTQPTLTPEQQSTLHNISVFKPTSHLFVAGDLNYRIDSTTPPPFSSFPSFDPSSEHYFPNFLPRDQLTQERLARRTLHGLTEAPIAFGPTYKYDVLSSPDDGAENAAAVRAGATHNGVPEVPWRFAPHRWPGWCDRVLYLDVPATAPSKSAIEVASYDSLPVVQSSDHRAVYLRASVPVLSAEEMLVPEEDRKAGVGSMDPRVNPPVAVDVLAWERRDAARRKEVVVGWSALVWGTKEGAVLLATLFSVAVGAWYAWGLVAS